MIPHERSLVERLQDQPFALLGVNSDPDKGYYRSEASENGVTWRSFWNGPKGTQGPISAKWNVSGWPTIYVIDAKGLIRYRDVRDQAMEDAVMALLAEVAVPAK